jgi:hypothetical protein
MKNYDLSQKTLDRINHKGFITDYYSLLQEDFEMDDLALKAQRMRDCNTVITLNRGNLHRRNLCHDKFCNNCNRVNQAVCVKKYTPVLKEQKANLYHMTLTQPNCSGDELKGVIKKMAAEFQTLVRILRCEIKIKGIDFASWGYEGAIRSLEVTFRSDPNDPHCYHPHYHAVLCLRHRTALRSREILIQKIWYLLMNDQPLTKKVTGALDVGYSCTINKFKKKDYSELFKYMIETTDENANVLTYQHFKTLYFALYRVKHIQGHGIFYSVKDEVTEADIE